MDEDEIEQIYGWQRVKSSPVFKPPEGSKPRNEKCTPEVAREALRLIREILANVETVPKVRDN